ncbi:MAG: hypothetical protein UT05_C0001G0107 [Parcubacteria group bacterium GW2011_GWF2_38_76]|nr:MAG: hypothetical protein UT05_C0001G0107 [Parcubacteria group bacterium GW2011_GWF2_38_76]HBM45917.1 hypothetical protein [Patescibacteria group bacterium]
MNYTNAVCILSIAILIVVWFCAIIVSSGISNLIDNNNVIPILAIIVISMVTGLWMFKTITIDVVHAIDPKSDSDKKE